MRLSEAITIMKENDELIDFPGPLRTTSGRSPEWLYRVMNQQEWTQAEQDGHLSPSRFYGRIHASITPETKYGSGNIVVRIKYDPADDWKAKGNLDGDVYAVTDQNIAMSKVERMR